MPRSLSRIVVLLVMTLASRGAQAFAQQDSAPPPPQAMVTGTVFDTVSGRPLRVAVVRVLETGASVLTDDAGRYRVFAAPGTLHLEVRRIGYEPASITVSSRRFMARDVYLRPIAIGLAAVTVTDSDDAGRRIIRRAIVRKHEIFAQSHDFSYDTYVKFVIRDLDRHPDSAESVLLMTETRTSAYWEQPNHFQERILARRQTTNLPSQLNLMSAGEIARFDRDRIEMFKYSLVSPIADDALEHYDYHVLDTLVEDGHRVYRLSIEPRSQATPLLVGMIDIEDSTYNVEQMDVGGNDVVRVNGARNLRYQQRFRDVGGGRFMPYDIRITGELLLTIPLPGMPTHWGLEHRALLDNFHFDQRERPVDLSEFRIVVDDRADRADTTRWVGPGVIPLTRAERAAWARIDSIESLPPAFGDRVVRGAALAYRLSRNPDFYHFDRVEGNYVGAGGNWYQIPGMSLRARLGYATGSEQWQYRFGSGVRIWEAQRVWLDASVYDETVNRPTLVSRDYNPTYRALFFRLDPLDYYREQGYTVSLSGKLVNFTELELHYRDARQSTLGVVTDYALFSVDRLQRPNTPIVDGRLRSLSARFAYDSRPLLRSKGQDYYLEQMLRPRTRLVLAAEIADPSLIPTDFNFRRYTVQLDRRQRIFNLGVTSFTAAAGIATGRVPTQRYYTVDFGMKALTFQGNGFNTMTETNYAGTRAAMIAFQHNFDRLLFAKTRLPLLRKLPFTLSIHGGAFWTDFTSDRAGNPGDSTLVAARTPYTEVGFGLGNLTPFLSPFNFAAHFTWQLSSYPTNRFTFSFGLTPP